MSFAMEMIRAFKCGMRCSHHKLRRKEKKIREHMSERQVDRMIEDSFPASDPPSTY